MSEEKDKTAPRDAATAGTGAGASPAVENQEPGQGTEITTRPGDAMARSATGSVLAPGLGGLQSILADGGGADATGQLGEGAATFGDILLAIGTGVAASQEALDKGVLETAKKLSRTQITYVSEVIQKLDEDGLPDVAKTELVETQASLLNFVRPTVHEWREVTVCIDLGVGEITREAKVRFQQKQAAGGFTAQFRPWGFSGWFQGSVRDTQVSAQSEAAWSDGQVRVDGELVARELDGAGALVEVVRGPQIFFTLGKVERAEGQDATMEIAITVLKADGDVNPGMQLEVDSGPFAPAFETENGFNGSQTNPAGKVKLTLTRDLARSPAPLSSAITAALGKVRKSITVTL